ncbi:MAG: S-methyl-5-thioribose-1-phosphate isomerase [Bacteriovoracaceae bacterium]|nr:S-methyl-5-thioribose-1-phosphate isomerase [Bacteriovoracaceae bacterium]
MRKVEPLRWNNGVLTLIDQRKLPHQEIFHDYSSVEGVHASIKDMVVRGAPLIGFTALFGMVIAAKNNANDLTGLKEAGEYLKTARPTAVNLAYEVDRALGICESEITEGRRDSLYQTLEKFSLDQMEKLYRDNLAMAKIAFRELTEKYGDKKLNLMTLCNTGFLACGPMGTALGVIEYAFEQGRVNHVYASETRPYLQGGRLTAYELTTSGIPHSVTVEGAFSYLMKKGLIDAIFIGADRIVENGDTANKVGSSTLAIVAKHYGIPFYTVAPTSTFDLSSKTGEEIEIELRPEEEVLEAMGERICPKESRALNPSFDVTDHQHLTGIICENGIIKDITPENVVKTVRG